MVGHGDGGDDLRVDGRVVITVAADHLLDVHPAGIPRQRRRTGPVLECRLKLRAGNDVEMVVDPDGVSGRIVIGRFGDGGLGLKLLDQIEPPPLRHESPKPHRHSCPPPKIVAIPFMQQARLASRQWQ